MSPTSQTLSKKIKHDELKLERVSLKDQATEVLRKAIITGQLPPGSKVTEQSVAQLLGTSKAPARDALQALEKEGLVVSKIDARYVLDFSASSVSAIYVVRRHLEKLAVELACQNKDSDLHARLQRELAVMKEAIAKGDAIAFRESDLETHRLIWRMSGNPYLWDFLNMLMGPIFMFVSVIAESLDNWGEVLVSHEEIISSIQKGDATSAIQSLDENFEKTHNRIQAEIAKRLR